MKKTSSHILPIACMSISSLLLASTDSNAKTSPIKTQLKSELTLGAAKRSKKKPVKKEKKLFVWGTGNYSKARDKYFLAQNKSWTFLGLLGMDYKITSDLKFGFFYSNGYTKSHTRFTTFTARSRDRSNANTIFLTGTYNFTPELFLIVALGYSHTPTNSSKFNNALHSWVTSKIKSNLYSVSPAFNYSKKMDDLTAAFQVGYGRNDSYRLAARDSNNRAIPKSSSHVNSTFFFTDWSYKFKDISQNIEGLSPFIQAGVNHNFHTPPLNFRHNIYHRSKTGWSTGAGLRFFFVNDISMNLGWQLISSKKKALSNGVGLTLRAGVY